MASSKRVAGSEIANRIRQRICLSGGTEGGSVLHEGALAIEFGLSRTPIRQVLQRLAYERLVQVQSGVGTIVATLDPEHRAEHKRVAVALLMASADCGQQVAVPLQARLEISALAGMLENDGDMDEVAIFDMYAQFLDIMAGLAVDTILEDALRASQWRLTRWYMHDFAKDPEEGRRRLLGLLQVARQAAETGDRSGLYTVVARDVRGR
ncbi:GntR family transcriptional regulator [Profundibacterium mesophilum]|uniref:Transcriptional regulator GntR family protein n=1 Tax=Profundibacterium mesophilum KAUST100406-0324 TaxID=1037889 RepID=A0A921NRP3_9RHOB|nr:GntR family transcriptional regulator [Profundibacterium mesophilum]KAF0676412.1 Transcriptional regulator GntR family protein [Profundibacterium mesophilum KAUST100406-0324]